MTFLASFLKQNIRGDTWGSIGDNNTRVLKIYLLFQQIGSNREIEFGGDCFQRLQL